MRLPIRKKIITGCESDGTQGSPYLTRYTLELWNKAAVYLHIFHRSDSSDMHDHPWPFISLILWRGYIEETPGSPQVTAVAYSEWLIGEKHFIRGWENGPRRRKRVWPGQILIRPADWVHRVELIDGKKAVTLVIRGAYCREWGFWTSAGWQRFAEYFKGKGC